MKTKQQPRHTITIEKDGRVRTSDRVGTGANAFFDEHVIGTIGVDVEIVDERDTFERWVDPVQQERTRIIETIMSEKKDIDIALNDPTADYIAEDAYDTKHEAFLYGYNQALTDIIKIIKDK